MLHNFLGKWAAYLIKLISEATQFLKVRFEPIYWNLNVSLRKPI